VFSGWREHSATLKVEDTSTSTTILNRSYAFGDGINLTGITDSLISARSESYTYTAANRLGQGTGIWGQLTWGYDGVGNRTSEVLTTGSTTTRIYSYSFCSCMPTISTGR